MCDIPLRTTFSLPLDKEDEMHAYFSDLFGVYSDSLKERTREIFDLYHNDDQSLSEVAKNVGNITRQGVRDSVDRTKRTLLTMERAIGMVRLVKKNRTDFKKVSDWMEDIETASEGSFFGTKRTTIAQGAEEIRQLAREYIEDDPDCDR